MVTHSHFNYPHHRLADNRLIDHVAQLKADNLKISVENEQLRSAVSTGGTGSNVAIATLEKKLLSQQEELTDLHKGIAVCILLKSSGSHWEKCALLSGTCKWFYNWLFHAFSPS